MKNRLLNEHVTRRMMKLAGIQALSENFVNENIYEEELEESEELEEEEGEEDIDVDVGADVGPDVGLDVPEPEPDPDLSANDLGDFLGDLTAWVDSYAEERGIPLDVGVDEEGEEFEPPPGEELEPPPGEELEPLSGEEEVPEELEEADIYVEDTDVEEDLVNEVTRRVARRLFTAAARNRQK